MDLQIPEKTTSNFIISFHSNLLKCYQFQNYYENNLIYYENNVVLKMAKKNFSSVATNVLDSTLKENTLKAIEQIKRVCGLDVFEILFSIFRKIWC